MIDWIDNNPSAFASLASAVIAASVALLVFSLSQYYSRRQNSMQFLAPRLEEVHQILDYEIEYNVDRSKIIISYIEGNKEVVDALASAHEVDLYGHRNATRVIMLVTLYFPKLSKIHQHLFRKQSVLNEVMHLVMAKQKIDPIQANTALAEFVHSVRMMRGEIVKNRDYLVGDCHPFKIYRVSTQSELDAVQLPPFEL